MNHQELEACLAETVGRIRSLVKAKGKLDSSSLTALSSLVRELRETLSALRDLGPVLPSGEETMEQRVARIKHEEDQKSPEQIASELEGLAGAPESMKRMMVEFDEVQAQKGTGKAG